MTSSRIEAGYDENLQTPGGKKQTSAEASTSEEDDEGPLPSEVLERLPPPMREMISQSIGIMSSGPMQNPIARKVTEEHIGKMIDNEQKDAERRYRLAQTGRFFTVFYVVIGIATFFGVAWTFATTDKELFRQIIAVFATFIAGFGAGWGFTSTRKPSDE